MSCNKRKINGAKSVIVKGISQLAIEKFLFSLGRGENEGYKFLHYF